MWQWQNKLAKQVDLAEMKIFIDFWDVWFVASVIFSFLPRRGDFEKEKYVSASGEPSWDSMKLAKWGVKADQPGPFSRDERPVLPYCTH